VNIKINKKINIFYYFINQKHNNICNWFIKIILEKNLDVLFFQNNTWVNLSEFFDKKDLYLFHDQYRVFSVRKNIEWRIHKHILLQWKKYFESNEQIINKLIHKEHKLTDVKNFDLSAIPIYLTININSKDVSAWYSVSNNNMFLVIEIPPNKKPNYNNLFPCAILLHEYFHLLIRRNYKLLQTINNFSKNINDKHFFEELIISSFVPEGYLGIKFLNVKKLKYSSKSKDLLDQRRYIADKMYNHAYKYVESNKKIDQLYLNLVKKLLLI